MKKLLLILTVLSTGLLQATPVKIGLPAPKYLSSPYFATCKVECPVVNHSTWQELDMACIDACIDLHAAGHWTGGVASTVVRDADDLVTDTLDWVHRTV